jgi:hypothetical protein
MSVHIVDDEQRSDRRATPMHPMGSGGVETSAERCLASAPTASGTRPLLILGQAPTTTHRQLLYPADECSRGSLCA